MEKVANHCNSYLPYDDQLAITVISVCDGSPKCTSNMNKGQLTDASPLQFRISYYRYGDVLWYCLHFE